MPIKQKKPVLDLPVKIILTEDGINFFIKNKKKLNKFKMADNVEEYGIFLDKFGPASVQRMMIIDYLLKIEISRPEFMSKRQEIMDLSKLIVYGMLYRQFDTIVLSKVLASDLIKRWNRLNPGSIIDDKTKINDSFLEGVISKNQDLIHAVKKEILDPVFFSISRNNNLLPEEKNIQLFLSEKFLNNLRPFIWFILSRFKGSPEYFHLIDEIREVLNSYMEKSKIAEYLSLMIMELAINSENTNMQNFAKRMYKGQFDPQTVMYDVTVRAKILEEMARRGENVFLSWKIGGKSSSIGTKGKLQVTLYNRESEYQNVKQQIEEKKGADLKKKSLQDFYKELPEGGQSNTELGLYYLSYLSEACDKVEVRFESNVSQLAQSDLTVITLNLNF